MVFFKLSSHLRTLNFIFFLNPLFSLYSCSRYFCIFINVTYVSSKVSEKQLCACATVIVTNHRGNLDKEMYD